MTTEISGLIPAHTMEEAKQPAQANVDDVMSISEKQHLDHLQVLGKVGEGVVGLAAEVRQLPEILLKELQQQCRHCGSRARREAHYAEEIDQVTCMWAEEHARHEKTKKDLDRYHAILHTTHATNRSPSRCDANSERPCIHHNPSTNELQRETCELLAARHMVDLRRSRLRQRARDFVLSVRKYEDFGRKYRTEMDRYSTWLDLRAQTLQRNYERYCEIMAENGLPPLLMYTGNDDLVRSKEEFLLAASEREEAAWNGTQTAYLEGRPNMLEGAYNI